MYGFWGTVLLAGMINHVFSQLHSARSASSQGLEHGFPEGASRKTSAAFVGPRKWLQKHMTLPPTFGSHHQERLWTCSVPTRLEFFILATYWIINLVLCCVSYEIFYPNL
jgi:hypothetical protein